MRLASLLLVVLGGAASAAAIVWLCVAGGRRARVLQGERATILTAAERGLEPPLPRGRWTTYGDAMTTRQDIELAIIANATDISKGPLVLVVVGIFASTAGSVLSLFL